MKATSLPNLYRETTSFPNFFTLYQDVDHDDDDMSLNDRPIIDHGDDSEASETSPFNDILSLSPLVSSNEIGFLAAPRSVMMFRRESTLPTSSVGSNQFSDLPEHEFSRSFNMREKNSINPELWQKSYTHNNIFQTTPELWQACSGPLVNLPAAGTHVVYFSQGHIEWIAAAFLRKDVVDAQIPNYPNLPSKLYCLLHNVTLHADIETDEVFAQMTLQPVPSFDKDALLKSDLSMNKPETEFFCKTLTASDTSTHGGFSVPRRAAEKIFPPLDFTMQPPTQELVARDLHDNSWTFRHVYRGYPKRHLLTKGWSDFVRVKKLFPGDSVLFIRDEKQQLLVGIRLANRQPTNYLPSSVLSSYSMQIGILAAAAHAAANNSPFTVFYNPRTSLSEFVIPLAKYYKAVLCSQISLGMRFGMMFETKESETRRYIGTITGITDLDPARWENSQWRNLQVVWDESTPGERRNRVSVWEIEPVTSPSFIFPTPPSQEGLNK